MHQKACQRLLVSCWGWGIGWVDFIGSSWLVPSHGSLRKPWITVTPCAQYWGMSIPIVEAYLGVLTCLTTLTMALTLTVTLTLALTLTLTLTLTLIYTHGRYTTAVTLTYLYLLT